METLFSHHKMSYLGFIKKISLTTSAAAPRYLGAKIAFHIQQQPLKWLKKKFFFANWIKFLTFFIKLKNEKIMCILIKGLF